MAWQRYQWTYTIVSPSADEFVLPSVEIEPPPGNTITEPIAQGPEPAVERAMEAESIVDKPLA
jgi:hypothetical protein